MLHNNIRLREKLVAEPCQVHIC